MYSFSANQKRVISLGILLYSQSQNKYSKDNRQSRFYLPRKFAKSFYESYIVSNIKQSNTIFDEIDLTFMSSHAPVSPGCLSHKRMFFIVTFCGKLSSPNMIVITIRTFIEALRISRLFSVLQDIDLKLRKWLVGCLLWSTSKDDSHHKHSVVLPVSFPVQEIGNAIL